MNRSIIRKLTLAALVAYPACALGADEAPDVKGKYDRKNAQHRRRPRRALAEQPGHVRQTGLAGKGPGDRDYWAGRPPLLG